ncbi:MAG: tetratricopeptide repeat protein [Eggerthellaceae bacterium]|nr:tetratricopeptide repeat protein [Eggerthellaceae bacterium]
MSLFDSFDGKSPSENPQQANTQLSAKELESDAMGKLLSSLLSTELPDAIDLIMLGPSSASGTEPGQGFALYAARLFSNIGASRIRTIAASYDIDVIRLSNTKTFWVRFPFADLSDDELSCVLAAEAAMNRLLFVKEAFDAQSTALVWSELDCALADASLISSLSAGASAQIKGAGANPLQEVFGVQGRKGGEWDLRTRFALAVESLRVPYRLSYSFDCNAAEGLFSIDYTAPLADWMPQQRFDVASGLWLDVSQETAQEAARYTLSVGVLLAAAAFGTSVGVRRVRISSHPVRLSADSAATLFFDRIPFISNVMPAIEAQDIVWMQHLLDISQTSDAAFEKSIRVNHKQPTGDSRPVPEELRNTLYADTVGELDVLSDMETDSWDTVHAAEADRHESPLAAIAVLESVVDEADKAVESLPTNTKALYCSDVVSRFLLPLNQVEDGTRFVRYSDSGFRARSILCDLYCEMGEPDRAIQQAEKCIELAPTSTIGYTDLVNALFTKQAHEEAIPYLIQALSYATQEGTIAYLYYRLAFALWQAGRREAALATYVLCMHHNFGRVEVVHQEMHELIEEMADPKVPSVGEARDILQREGITPAPSPQLRQLVASQLVSLVDHGILDIAAPLSRMVGSVEGHRDELYAVGESLQS